MYKKVIQASISFSSEQVLSATPSRSQLCILLHKSLFNPSNLKKQLEGSEGQERQPVHPLYLFVLRLVWS